MTTLKMTKSKMGIFYVNSVGVLVCGDSVYHIWGISPESINLSISKTLRRGNGWKKVQCTDNLNHVFTVGHIPYFLTSQQRFYLSEKLGIKGDFWVRAKVYSA